MTWTEVAKAEYVDGYRLMIWFNDGMKKIVDLSDIIEKYPVFQPLSDMRTFQRFNVTDTLEWHDGQIDIAPEYLYEHGVQA